ncbi:MAG: hypothetical protein M1546_17805 [Chloroflexi bacterium]|nr:hypothetical protein [Chloroflexota bacterium]
MTIKRLVAIIGAVGLIALIGVFAASTVFAQTPTPAAPSASPDGTPGSKGIGRGFGLWGGGSTAQFDAVAEALNLTPAQLFEQLHSGKTLEEIAQAQGVDIQKVQDALNASRIQAMKDAISQAVTDGKMTQAQADWMLEGLEKGYLPMGRGGFGFGHGGRGGPGKRGPAEAPTAPASTPGATT